MRSDNTMVEQEGFAGFKRWLVSLSKEELLDAMAFTFQPTANASKNKTMLSSGSISSIVESHDHELLLSMVRLQPPPPTPVHPRATGYRSRSQKGARLDYFYREEEYLRWTKPRLFQLIDENEARAFLNDAYGLGNRGRLQSRNRKNNFGRKNSRRFNVIARQKVAPWGDIYSLGCTQEQRDADSRIIEGIRLGRHRIDGVYHATGCFVCPGESSDSSNQGSRAKQSNDYGHEPSASSILNILRIASRGHFFRNHPKLPSSRTSARNIAFCAPWLKPTERCFSLSMYLASRFQIALWDSYIEMNLQKPRQSVHPGRIIRQGGTWYDYDERILKRAMIGAIRLSLRDILEEEKDASQLTYLRDGTIWALLKSDPVINHCLSEQIIGQMQSPVQRARVEWRNVARVYSQSRLVEIHSPFISRFKRLVIGNLEAELAVELQRTMFEEDEKERKNGGNHDVADALAPKKKRNKNQKNKKKKRNGSSTKVFQQKLTNGNPSITPYETNADKELIRSPSDSSSVEGEREAKSSGFNSPIDFPKNLTTARDRNRNIVSVLGILEDAIENVFAEVGLEPTPKFDEPDQDDAITPECKSTHTDETELASPNDENNTRGGDDDIKVYMDFPSGDRMSEDMTAGLIHTSRNPDMDMDITKPSDSNAFSLYTAKPDDLPSTLYSPLVVGRDLALSIGSEMNSWPFINRFQSREESILSSFFQSQNTKVDEKDDVDDEERLMAASTAASIASSNYKDTTYVAETEEELIVPLTVVTEQTQETIEMIAIHENDDGSSKYSDGHIIVEDDIGADETQHETSSVESSIDTDLDAMTADFNEDKNDKKCVTMSPEPDHVTSTAGTAHGTRSPTLQPPVTPPPTLSPILISLADLKKVKYNSSVSLKRFPSLDFDTPKSKSGPGSLPPASPNAKNRLVNSWSREDLRIESFRDDHNIKNRQKNRIKHRREADVLSYKSVVVKTFTKPPASSKDDTGSLDHGMRFLESRRKQDGNKELCAQSETAMSAHHADNQDWYREEIENQSLTRDENTTIISGISHRGEAEAEELAEVQEERNHFRDMCLTLGAEVAKLKVMLATQQAAASVPIDFQESSFGYRKMYGHGSFDPHGMQPFFHGAINSNRPGPMSDAGFHRYGDHESLFSEDDVYDPGSKPRTIDTTQRITSNHTVGESDASVDFASVHVPLTAGQMPGTMSVYNTFQSRLSKDILQFLDATNTKMRQLDGRRKLAVERFSRLVKTVWPRAQVKLYGSYMSGLCLPSSDLDFVVCLPAVHKKDLALAPGVLEGRNAINETSQKLLARELKGESWIDPRSIKVIERTAVPVIKVSTKDTRARMIQLDISFDGPEHHGLEANEMVAQTLEELPLIRPLMLVLKQFLLHRGLLTAYTGGLSSYCLFLMLARYLQEQPPSSSDCGSLLMGFLDFYGNCFDPRAIGISVGGRQYFARANSHTAAAGYEPTGQPIWNGSRPPHQPHVVINDTSPTSSSIEFRRRNSFSDAGSVDDSRLRHRRFAVTPSGSSVAVTSGSTHRYGHLSNTVEMNYRNSSKRTNTNYNNNFDRPSTFDPLFVEDPLSATNNVGRNAFRINQVQRAFSDAHRALVATLDWDIQPAEGSGKYPLLKCLLGNQTEL